jgi:hypothetical protein
MARNQAPAAHAPTVPWWRFPIVWFTLAGPALVVVASFATMAIAFVHADVAIAEAPARSTNAMVDRAGPTAPALQARNHAAAPATLSRP